jgi:mevalonate kinase
MAPVLYSASAPGSLMLFGEHAVLHDRKAIVAALDKRIVVNLELRSDLQVRIQSNLGIYESSLENLTLQNPFQFVIAAILSYGSQLSQGFNLSISSDFSEKVGLGSSAAVVVCVISVLEQWTQEKKLADVGSKCAELSDEWLSRIFTQAREVVLKIQGVGSGADVAASVFGGCLLYTQKGPYPLKKLETILPLVVVYSGSKTPTPVVIRQVEQRRKRYSSAFNALYNAMNYLVEDAVIAIEQEDWKIVGEIMNMQQGMMNALGVGTPILTQVVEDLNAEATIYGAKISGSGLGDCVVGIGEYLPCPARVGEPMKVMISKSGVRCE